MTFLSIRFDADAEGAERWSDALIEAGALSVDVSDPASLCRCQTCLLLWQS